jgi:hypothetical protein
VRPRPWQQVRDGVVGGLEAEGLKGLLERGSAGTREARLLGGCLLVRALRIWIGGEKEGDEEGEGKYAYDLQPGVGLEISGVWFRHYRKTICGREQRRGKLNLKTSKVVKTADISILCGSQRVLDKS